MLYQYNNYYSPTLSFILSAILAIHSHFSYYVATMYQEALKT